MSFGLPLLNGLHYFPHPPLFTVLFFLILGLVFALLRFGIISYVYERLGLSSEAALWFLVAALLGSAINIPVARLPAQDIVKPMVVQFYGVQYVIPFEEREQTVLAVNVGGAVIPVLLVGYLIIRNGLRWNTLVALGAVTLIVHQVATPVAGVGVVIPPLVGPLSAAAAALLTDRRTPSRTAFIAGTLGSLIGADLMNLEKIQGLGAPIASIGGAGTFDGVFMTGILAVLLAGISESFGRVGGRRPSSKKDRHLSPNMDIVTDRSRPVSPR